MKHVMLQDPKTVKLINKHSEDILRLIDNQDDFTRSDLQGAADAIVINILNSGFNLERIVHSE